MTAALDPRESWWWWRDVSTRLTKWCLALLRGKRYSVRLAAEGTGYHDAHNQVIQANPQLFSEEEPEVQFRLTQGILAHEAGHAWFTSAWPEQSEGRLQEATNILEDARIEAAICVLYPGIRPAIQLLGDHMLARQNRLPWMPACDQAYACCLVWRWAYSRIGEPAMLDLLGIGEEAKKLWREVKPLVEQAWRAHDTHQVIVLARRILERLGIDPKSSPLKLIQLPGGNIPLRRTDRALPFPAAPAQGEQPGLGKSDASGSNQPLFGDRFSEPAPYVELEDRARPIARQLAAALRLPTPDTRPEPHESQGRYSFRQEVRTPETPHLLAQSVASDPRDLALYLLVDRSGSMRDCETQVRLALMSLYLAAVELEIPTGLAFFGAHSDADRERVLEAAPLSVRSSETVKALIAGFTGRTHYEFLDWGLKLAETALQSCPQRRKFIVVCHDGDPVYEGAGGNDLTLSHTRIRRLERAGIAVIGVYLGDDAELAAKLKRLFPYLIISSNNDLPDKLGNLLRSLA
jgi:hypothetical protein